MITQIERERELCRLWQRLPAPGVAFSTLQGERIVLIAQGRLNDGPGPDFSDAVLLINGTLRVGPVEMHLRESDWFAHGHQNDPAYSGVLLHVLAGDPRPDQLRLTVPTVSARQLIDAAAGTWDTDPTSAAPGSVPVEYTAGETVKPKNKQENGGGTDAEEGAGLLSTNLLAELSWGRFLRRVTEILRDERGGDHPDNRILLAFLFRLFDSLGYSRNRLPMKQVAEQLAATFIAGGRGAATGCGPVPNAFAGPGFDEMTAMIFAVAGIPAARLEKVGEAFMARERLQAILPAALPQGEIPGWDYRGRPANAPERRLWGGAKLSFDLFRRNLLEDSLERIRLRKPYRALLQPFLVKLGSQTILGRSRAEEIVVNALCPVALAAGVLRGDRSLIEGACLAYRNAPSLTPNRIVREVEEKFGGENLQGAFLQQGAIEYYQRLLSPDRSGYSMIAEPGS